MSDDPYKVLQVDPEADPEVVQAAYRRLARKYHPDVATDPGAAARMAALNRAWEAVGHPDRRAEWDRARSNRLLGTAPASGATGPASSGWAAPTPPRQPPTDGGDWTGGRSHGGSGYDPTTMRSPEGFGAAGPPPGNPSGDVLAFGRYAGWSLGEVARRDLDYVEWLDRMPIGRPYRDEIDGILRRTGRRRAAEVENQERRGLFRRR